MRKYLVVITLIFLLAIPLPVSAQTAEPYTDPCDQLPLRDWPDSRNIQVQNGVCALQNGGLGPKNPLNDFIVRFKVSMDAKASLVFSYGTSMNDLYEFTITPIEASLVNYIRFGNASSTVKDKVLAKAPLQIGSGQWVQMEFGMQAKRQWLVINGKTVIDRETDRFHGVGITGSNGVYLDDIQLVQDDLSVTGQPLPGFPADLAQTWIAYMNSQYELALIHPDGSGMKVLASPLSDNLPPQALFSPDGKTLLIDREDVDKSLLSFYSTETLQFIGTEISFPRAPIIDWMPDSQHIIVLRDDHAPSLIFEKINIQTGQVIATFPIPARIDEQSIDIRSVITLDCSPTAESIAVAVYADAAGENVKRAILFNLASREAHFLPGSEVSLWSPDGDMLLSTAGGLIDPQSLIFTELPADLVKRITNYRNYAWSPNRQFIHIGTENAGNGQYAVYLADLETQKVITLPLIGFGSFAPDSLHFVFSDQGRLIIRSLFDETELQIAEGSVPIWQPAPGMFPVESIQPAQSTATAVANYVPPIYETPQKASATASSLTETVQERSPLDGELADTPARPIWAVALLLISLLGLVAAGVFAYLRYIRRCPSCKRSNPGSDPFCMYCGSRLTPPARIGSVLMILAMLAGSGCLGAGGIAGLLIRPKQKTTIAVMSTGSPELSRQNPPQTKPTESHSASSPGFPCGTLDLAKSDLLTVLQMSGSTQTDLSQIFGQFGKTPAADKTAEVIQAATQIAQYEELIKNTCTVSFLSISPDGQSVLVSGSHIAIEAGQIFWAALYNRHTYQPIWVQPTEIETPPFDEFVWSPTGDRYAVSGKNVSDEEAITVYETSTGLPISKIPASTRKGAYCLPMSTDKGQFRWLSDGKRLIRKIDNAVQVLDVTTGNVLNEISFDDSAMGSPHAPPDDNRCFFVMAWAADGSRFATLGASIEVSDHPSFNGLKVWDAESSKLVAEKRPGVRYPSSISFSPDGKKILVTGSSPIMIDAQTGQTIQELKACPACSGPSSILWTPDSQQLLIYEDNTLALFDLATQSWKTMALSAYRGAPQEWLDDQGCILLTGNGLPTVANILSGEEFSLLEYFNSSQ